MREARLRTSLPQLSYPATSSASSTATMVEDHPFTFSVEPHTMGYYRWSIKQGGWMRDISSQPYATRAEATAAATEAMLQLIELWRKKQLTGNLPRARIERDGAW